MQRSRRTSCYEVEEDAADDESPARRCLDVRRRRVSKPLHIDRVLRDGDALVFARHPSRKRGGRVNGRQRGGGGVGRRGVVRESTGEEWEEGEER